LTEREVIDKRGDFNRELIETAGAKKTDGVIERGTEPESVRTE